MPQKPKVRMLAAIMFADIVGYSKMMQENEENALFLRNHQRSIIEELLPKYQGKVMQFYGDGTLLMFNSALDAVNFGREVQKELMKEPRVPLRIGIHVGDIIYDEEGIYGDAVNIAARVQALGVAGSIMLSAKVVDELKNHSGFRLESFGEHELKNIFMHVGIYAIADSGFNIPTQAYVRKLTGTDPKSIAVLPFKNFSSDKSNDYFSDGITDEIINTLAKIEELHVVSRTSVFKYKDRDDDIREIGKNLGVNNILEGSVQKAGNRVRVTAQLINADNGFHIWSDHFDGDITDIFALQDEISLKIAHKIEENLSLDRSHDIFESATDNVEAYNYYLQGLYFWNKRTPEFINKSIDFFKKAIGECETYNDALAYLADCYTYLGTGGHMPWRKAFKEAEKFALKAIEVNDTHADSYVSLAYVNMLFRWDFHSSEENLRKAITIDPGNSQARQALSLYYRITGDYGRMLSLAEAGVNIEPLSLPALVELGRAHCVVGDFEKSLATYNKVIDLDPLYRSAMEGKVLVHITRKEYEIALSIIGKFREHIDSNTWGTHHFAFIHAKMGNREIAEDYVELIKNRDKHDPNLNPAFDYAIAYTALGDHDKAFEYLNKSVSGRLRSVLIIDSLSYFEDLKSDTRYHKLLQEIGLNK